MDRNQAIGLALMGGLLLVYLQFFSPEPPIVEEQPAIAEQVDSSSSSISSFPEDNTLTDLDSARQAQLSAQFVQLSQGLTGTSEVIDLENENISVKFNSKGGLIQEVLLKDYLTYDKKPLFLLDEQSSRQKSEINTKEGLINLSDRYYTVSKSKVGDSSQVRFKLEFAPGKSIEHIYTLPTKGYAVLYSFEQRGIENELVSKELSVKWDYNMMRFEQEIDKSRKLVTINYYTSEFDNLNETSEDPELVSLNETAKWFSFKHKFFTTGILAPEGLQKVSLKTTVDLNDTLIIKKAVAEYTLSLNDQKSELTYYFGPNNYQILKKMPDSFSKNVYLGWAGISWFNKWLIVPLFNFLENYISNYGIIILILVFIIKLLLSPLSYKSYVSMAKMKVINNLIKPDLDAFKAKSGDDQSKVQQEQMRLYQNLGISPLASMSGCVPMLLQMPILLALFNFFPNSVELRQESFLWAHDLSTYDSILDLSFNIPFYGDHVSLFTLLMTVSTLVVTHFNSQNTAAVQGPMKSLQYMMPIMFLFFLNSFAAGLTFYYFIANLITFGQQTIIKRFVDEDKIQAMVESNRTKNTNKKKSKFQQRLEDAMKAKEETVKSKKVKTKKK